MADKKISELPVASGISGADISVLAGSDQDYQYSFSTLLNFVNANLSAGSKISFGTTIPQNITGNNGEVFLKTDTFAFYQKLSGTWVLACMLPTGSNPDGTILYGSGVPGSTIGLDKDSYIDTSTGIFYLKTLGSWVQVFSMATGPQGPQGMAGTNGTNGTSGNAILQGTTNPSNSTDGVNGDYYINVSTYTFFGPKITGVWGNGVSIIGADGAQGAAGINGTTGTNGNTILYGSSDPINSQGNNGDFHLNTTTYYLFGPKASGTWPAGIALVGSTGPIGATGDAGAKGANGEGVPTGGTAGQILAKINSTDFNTQWVAQTGGGGILPIEVADTSYIPFTNMLTMVADHSLTDALVITPNTVGALAGCGAVQRVIANNINIPDISAFKKLATSYNYDNTQGAVNIFIFYFDGVSYNVAITQNGEIITPPTPPAPTPTDNVNAWAARLLSAGYTLPSDRKTAYVNFITALQNAGVYSLITEMWMFEGGAASTNQLGFKGLHNGVIHGTLTHDSTGSTGDRSSGYMDLGVSPDNILGGGNVHMACYLRKSNGVGDDAIGVRGSADYYISPRFGGSSYFSIDQVASLSTREYSSDVSGRYIMSRINTTLNLVRNGTGPSALNPACSGTVTAQTSNYSVFASIDGGSALAYSDQEIGFASVGAGLTGPQTAAYDSALATLFTALAR